VPASALRSKKGNEDTLKLEGGFGSMPGGRRWPHKNWATWWEWVDDPRKGKPLRRGRVSTADKIKLAGRTEKVYPEGVAADQCKLSHTRVVWRLEEGPAVLVAYEIYRVGAVLRRA